jgi:uncharacterized protein YndB with AHSA1/START domain
MATITHPAAATERVIVISRDLAAPRERVWRAWTDPQHIPAWFGPKGFSAKVAAQDFRPAGHWRYVMIGPDGTEYPSKGTFQEIVPQVRIVTTDEFDEGFDKVVKVDLPRGIVATTLFEDRNGGTRLTTRIDHATVEDRRKHEAMGVIDGSSSMLDCLEEYLAAMP